MNNNLTRLYELNQRFLTLMKSGQEEEAVKVFKQIEAMKPIKK